MTLTQRLANPTRFMAMSSRLLPWMTALALVLLATGLWLGFRAPPDYQQAHTVKIMFIHVPAAWMAMAAYSLVAVSGIGLLVFRHPLADVSAKAAAPLGAALTFLALVTGSLWGKPMWGTYWVWDGRLTSVLLLFFLYVGLIALRSSLDDEALAGKLTAILAVVGIVILPVIKFSVDWWHTLHQPSTNFTQSLDPAFRVPLLVMAAAFAAGFAAMHMKAMQNEILRRRARSLMLGLVDRAGRGAPDGAAPQPTLAQPTSGTGA